MKHEILLECKNISKRFGPTKALINVDLTFKRGEIHGLIGENGSGKSTLTSIIAGIHKPTEGTMIYKGQDWAPTSPLQGREAGVRIVVQEAGTIRTISVAENIFVGQEEKFQKGIIVSRREMNAEAKKALEKIGVNTDEVAPNMQTNSIDLQQRKLVEMARAAYGTPEIFIVDETTTALSQSGREILYNLMHTLAAQGVAVILISHDFSEVLEHCDIVTVLRDGVRVAQVERENFDESALKQMMVGREFSEKYYRTDYDGYSDEVVLRAENITTLQGLMNFNIELHRGEILGIGGLSECGMHVLGKALFGFEKLVAGKVMLPEKNICITNCEVAEGNGIAYLSKDRDIESLALNAPVRENIQSTGLEINRGVGFAISGKKEKKYVQDQIKTLSIKCSSMDAELSSLSGGNKQKVVFGKWLARNSDILIFDCPTRGVDVGVSASMYDLIYEMKKAGKSMIIISEEMTELIGMSDRLLILKEGEIVKEVLRSENPKESQLIEYMI